MSHATVTVDTRVVGSIAGGLLVLLGVERGDTMSDVQYVAGKIRDMRIFPGEPREDGQRRLERSLSDVGGAVLVVSQFTLAADVRNGRRPSFDGAAAPDLAREQYESVVRELRAAGLPVETGEFQADMRVLLENDGPVTILLDSRRTF